METLDPQTLDPQTLDAGGRWRTLEDAFDLALLIGERGTQMIDLMIDLALLIGGDGLVVMDVCLTLN